MSEDKREKKVRFYPSGMIEVTGADSDEIALISAEIAKGIHPYRPSSTAQAELPLLNGHTKEASAETPKLAISSDGDGPFYDPSVTQFHPAVQALENHVLQAAAGTKFEYHWLRVFVGKKITGRSRECLTRSVGTLMTRLVKSGIVSKIDDEHWTKAAKISK